LDSTCRGRKKNLWISTDEPCKSCTEKEWINVEEIPTHENWQETSKVKSYQAICSTNQETEGTYGTYRQMTPTEEADKKKDLEQKKYTMENGKLVEGENGNVQISMTVEEQRKLMEEGDKLFSFQINYDVEDENLKAFTSSIIDYAGETPCYLFKKGYEQEQKSKFVQAKISVVLPAKEMLEFLNRLDKNKLDPNVDEKNEKTRLITQKILEKHEFAVQFSSNFDQMIYYARSKIEKAEDRKTVTDLVNKYVENFHWALDYMNGLSNTALIVKTVGGVAVGSYLLSAVSGQSVVFSVVQQVGVPILTRLATYVVRMKVNTADFVKQIGTYFKKTETSEYGTIFNNNAKVLGKDEREFTRNDYCKVATEIMERKKKVAGR